MSNMPGLTEGSAEYVPRLVFTLPPPLWVGLSMVAVSDETQDALAAAAAIDRWDLGALDEVTMETIEASEPVGAPGYKRERIDPKDWAPGDRLSIEAIPLMFRNNGRKKWPPVNVGFLTTTEEAGGRLVSWSFNVGVRTLYPGDGLENSVSFASTPIPVN